MAGDRPAFRHRAERRGLIGPFTGRHLVTAFGAVVGAVVVLVVATTPLGSTAGPPILEDPRATPFIIGEATEGLQVGDLPPEFTVPLGDGSNYQLRDLDGNPIRLADLRGKAVWINFFASWCPPCQTETPILRSIAEEYRDRGLEVVAVSVQETIVEDVRAYAERYELDFTIGFDGSGHVFREYLVYALPTQFFLDEHGVIRFVVQGPLTETGARQRVEAVLPES